MLLTQICLLALAAVAAAQLGSLPDCAVRVEENSR